MPLPVLFFLLLFLAVSRTPHTHTAQQSTENFTQLCSLTHNMTEFEFIFLGAAAFSSYHPSRNATAAVIKEEQKKSTQHTQFAFIGC